MLVHIFPSENIFFDKLLVVCKLFFFKFYAQLSAKNEYIALKVPESHNFMNERNSVNLEFHVSFAKIILVLSTAFPLFQQIFIFYLKTIFFVTATIVYNITDNFVRLIFFPKDLKIFHIFCNIHSLNKFSSVTIQSTNKNISSQFIK